MPGRPLARLHRRLRGAARALGAMALPIACARAAPVSAPKVAPPASAPPVASDGGVSTRAPAWPAPLVAALAGHGGPHGQPLALPRDAGGRDRWLAFVGTDDVALGAWHVSLAPDGATQAEPVARWPAGVRVVGGVVERGIAYVLLETLPVLDQPAGLRGVWIDSPDRPSAFEASPLALADVSEVSGISARLGNLPPPAASLEHNTTALLSTLRTASVSAQALTHSLAPGGADVQVSWQSLFVRSVGHLDAEGTPPADLAERALALVREVLGTQACGPDACEAWTDRGRAVVRFAAQDGRWGIRSLIEEAPAPQGVPGQAPPREVDASANADATRSLLEARVKDVRQVLGEAPLGAGGGTIGVALTDAAPDAPCVVVREGAAARMFALDVGPIRAEAKEASWDVGFVDVDGDGRTDVALRMTGARADGSPLVWTQVILAPPASVQTSSLEADLASALAAMDAPDARAAARATAAASPRGVSRDEACQSLASATTPAGFRRAAAPGARLMLFQEPGRPTWRPKIVPLSKIAAGDVHGLGAHCAELKCDKTRPYCSYTMPGDSLHVWFAWNGGRLEIAGVADYSGE